MGYIENNLVKGEEIIFRTRYHWFVIFSFALRSLIVFGFLALLMVPSTGSSASLTCVGFLSIFAIVPGYIKYSTSEFGLTNRRVLIKSGWLRHETLELNLGRIESFQARSTLLGRMLGFSDLTLTGSGGTRLIYRGVAHGDLFRKRVVEHSTDEGQYRQAPAPVSRDFPTSGDPFEDIADQQFNYAQQLYRSGKVEQAIGVLEVLSAQGYERAQRALDKIKSS